MGSNSDLEEKIDSDLLDIPITQINCSLRVKNALEGGRILYLGQLISSTEVEVYRKRGIGPVAMKEIKSYLKKEGLNLGMKVNYTPPEQRIQ